jgi:hypothetical protein
VTALLPWFEFQYSDTGNGLFAWAAYQFCRRYDADPPGWVLRYLDRAAVELLASGKLTVSGGRGHRHLQQFTIVEDRLDLAFAADELREGKRPTEAEYRSVAEKQLGHWKHWRAIERAWRDVFG